MRERVSIRTAIPVLPLLALGLLVAGCDKQRAFGAANSIVVAAPTDLWAEVQDTVASAMQPSIFTVRQERTFEVTQQDPTGEAWSRLQLFRQVLVIGSENDPWVAEALEYRRTRDPLSPPQIVQARDVWAREQLVTIMLLPEGGGAEDVIALLDPLHELLDGQYRDYARSRMFVSGRDTTRAATVRREAGFTLDVPSVYRENFQDSVYIFRNDQPTPSERIRQVTVTWRSPIPEERPGADALLAWRRSVADGYYQYYQVNDTTQMFVDEGEFSGMPMTEIQAVWSNPPEDGFPAGGPFILRAIECREDDRLYLLDAWLYAPNQSKYEYMIQLEAILDSFRCAEAT